MTSALNTGDNKQIGNISYIDPAKSPSTKNQVEGKLDNKTSVIIVDVGSGEGSIVKFVLDLNLGLVYEEFRHKIDRVNSSREFTANIIDYLSAPELKDIHTIINLTSWARNNPSGVNARLVRVLGEVKELYSNIIVNVITQRQEAKISELSLKHVLQFINPVLRKIMNPSNTIQLEAGKGSTQSAAVIPEQKEEIAGSWADQQLKEGKNILEVVKMYKDELIPQMTPREAIQGKSIVAMQGLFANGLEDKNGKEILKFLGINNKQEEIDWNSGQLLRSIDLVIAACEHKVILADKNLKTSMLAALKNSNIQKLIFGKEETKRNYADDIKAVKAYLKNDPDFTGLENDTEKKLLKDLNKALNLPVPAALTLGMLQAFVEKYGHKFEISNQRQPNPLYFDNGTPMGKEIKVSGTHGAAIKHFIKIGLVEKIITSSWKQTGSVQWRKEDIVRLKPVDQEIKKD